MERTKVQHLPNQMRIEDAGHEPREHSLLVVDQLVRRSTIDELVVQAHPCADQIVSRPATTDLDTAWRCRPLR